MSQAPALLPHEEAGLTEQQYAFCLEYLANGFNAAAAARAAYPKQTERVSRQQGYENLTKPDIRAYLHAQVGPTWKKRQIDDEQALARLGMDATSDIRMLFNAKGELLPPHEWPDDIVNSIDAVDMANGKVKLVPKLHARRTILEVHGRLKTSASEAVDELAKLMKEDIERSRKAGIAPSRA